MPVKARTQSIFANHGYQVLATDFSQFALDQISDARIQKQLVDLTQPLPFPNNSFDIVYSHLALHYFSTPRTQALFDEILASLKPKGVFATLTNSIDDPEVTTAIKIEDEFYRSGGVQKRYFSVTSMEKFTSKFQTLLLDNHGQTHKDKISTLIRFVGRKP